MIIPKISIIITTFNSEAFLSEALESIDRSYSNLEVIIADGGSSDSSLKIANDFGVDLILEGPDQGVYDGMNRGILAATGDYILLLNSDDLMSKKALDSFYSAMKNYFEHNGSFPDMITGGAEFFGEISKKIYPARKRTYWNILFAVPCINARLIRRDLFLKHPFCLSIGLGADRYWLLNSMTHALKTTSTSSDVYIYRQHKNSYTLSGDDDGKSRVLNAHIQMISRMLEQNTSSELKAFASWQIFKMQYIYKMPISNEIQAIFSFISLIKGGLSWIYNRGKMSGF